MYFVRRLGGFGCSPRVSGVSRLTSGVLQGGEPPAGSGTDTGVMQSRDADAAELLHMCSIEDWARARALGEHRPTSLVESGFIHLSAPYQIHLPANRLYRGRCDLVVLSVALNLLDCPVRWEPGVPSDPESMLFPHLYGPLPIAAVTSVANFRPGPDGFFEPLAQTTY
ncbi:glutathione S-transferase domain-containing protein [Mycobacteroides abscessus subsp. massiliense]|nr:glutathione S-transferase domain-containing protein [Mycobacteroides abscessus subsp. massiliense]SKV81047.1 glutathione S-transferase domain-containing protein [Mycobacteroides abscessus subsp. massiliense]